MVFGICSCSTQNSHFSLSPAETCLPLCYINKSSLRPNVSSQTARPQVCTGAHLPTTEDEFFDILREFFPRVYDMKYLMKFCDLHGGLNKLAEFLGVRSKQK